MVLIAVGFKVGVLTINELDQLVKLTFFLPAQVRSKSLKEVKVGIGPNLCCIINIHEPMQNVI